MNISPRDAVRPCAFFLNGIGDHFLALPAVRALADLFDGRLTLLCSYAFADLLYADLPLARVLPIYVHAAGDDGYRFNAARVAERVGAADLFLALHPWHSQCSRELVERLRPAASAGFFPGFDVVLSLDYDVHSTDLAFAVARVVDPALAIEPYAGPFPLPAADVAFAREIRAELQTAGPVLAVHLETAAEKTLSTAAWAAVIDRFLAADPEAAVLVLGKQDGGLDAGPRGDRVYPCHGLPLGKSLALLAAADLFLGVDSCMLHAADLLRVPSVAVFGPTAPHEFGLRFAPGRHVRLAPPLAAADPAPVSAALQELGGAWRSRTAAAAAGRHPFNAPVSSR